MSEPLPALKNWFDEARFRKSAKQLSAISADFDAKKFLKHALVALEDLTLMQRLRRMSESLHVALPANYRASLDILRIWAPQIDHSFITLVLPDFVGLYGHDHFKESMNALAEFTCYGSAEFAVREFLKRDLQRTLGVMKKWSKDRNEHVRRLACEGCRPRLPWSFRLDALIKEPELVRPILHNLRADASLYVRKSVGNHLNDITKDHPEWVLAIIGEWDLENAHTAWIAKRGLRTLIKSGHPAALAVIGAGEKAQVKVHDFSIVPEKVHLGERIKMHLDVTSTASVAQKLVIDYTINYVKKAGGTSPKVFKWKEVVLPPLTSLQLVKEQRMQNFTTRVHHAGKHRVDVMINGELLASDDFNLSIE